MDAPTIWIAFFAGIISFISPCVLPLLPVYLAIASAPSSTRDENYANNRLKVLRSGFLIMLGFTFMFFIMMGPLIALFGIRLLYELPWLESLAGALFLVFGIWLLPLEGVPVLRRIKAPFSIISSFDIRIEQSSIFAKRFKALIPIALGASLAIVWIPCIGPYLGAILLLAGSAETLLSGSYLLLAYCAGLSVPFIASALFLDRVRKINDYLGRLGVVIRVLAAIFMLAFGVIALTGNMTWLSSYFTFLGGSWGI